MSPPACRQVSDYFSRRKEGPKPNATAAVAPFPDEEGGVGVGVGGASRAVQSYSGYHCRRADYKARPRPPPLPALDGASDEWLLGALP